MGRVCNVALVTAKQLAGTTRTADRARLLLLVAVAGAIGHQAVYLTHLGATNAFADAMARHGHPASVPLLLIVAVASSAAFVGIVGWRLRRLIRSGAVATSPSPADPSLAAFACRWWRLTCRVAPATILWYLVQENAEHLLGHGHFDGLMVLGGADAVFTLCVLTAVSAIVSLVGLVVRWPEIVLEQRLAAATASRLWPHPATRQEPAWDAAAAAMRSRWILCRRISGRAPPVGAVA